MLRRKSSWALKEPHVLLWRSNGHRYRLHQREFRWRRCWTVLSRGAECECIVEALGMSFASLYERRGTFYTTAQAKTVNWLHVISPPFVRLEANCDDEVLGKTLLEALAAWREEVPDPPINDDAFGPVLELAGLKSYQTFLHTAKYVRVKGDTNGIAMIPTRNGGIREGFHSLVEDALTIEEKEPKEVGIAARLALSRAK